MNARLNMRQILHYLNEHAFECYNQLQFLFYDEVHAQLSLWEGGGRLDRESRSRVIRQRGDTVPPAITTKLRP